MAEFVDLPVRQIRTAWVLATLLTGFAALFVYIACVFIFPPPDDFDLEEFRVQ